MFSRLWPDNSLFAMLSFLSILLIAGGCFLAGSDSYAQETRELTADTLAQVGRKVITARDLIERVELMPWMGKDNPRDQDSAKIKALQSLVAEHILAEEAAAQGLGGDSTFLLRAKNLERLMVRDELYNQEVKTRVRISEAELREGLERFAWQVKVLMISVQREESAKLISVALRSGARPDSTTAHPPGGLPVTTDTVTVNLGLLERWQEDVVYALADTAPASDPLNVPRLGWVVLYLLEKESNPEYVKQTSLERSKAVATKLRARKEVELANRVYADLLLPRRAETKSETFGLFARTIYEIVKSDSPAYRAGSGYRLDLLVDVAEARLAPHLNDVMVEMEGQTMSIADVLEGYRSLEFVIPSLNQRQFRAFLNESVKEVVAREFVAREGYRRRLDQTAVVQHDVATWTNYWLARSLEREIEGNATVSNEEVVVYLTDHADAFGDDYEVNVREVLLDSLSEAISIVEKITSGADIKELARRFSKRKEWAMRDGESGFFPIVQHPDIGIRALEADTGRIVAPVHGRDGYSVFAVLGKREAGRDSVITYDSLKTLVRTLLIARKGDKLRNAFIASTAASHEVKICYRCLQKIDFRAINMVTKRVLGFGGAMLAVPPLTPNWEWVRSTNGVQEVFP